MKDLYSFHTSIEDFEKYYEVVKKVYLDIFEEVGIGKDTMIVLAAGGDFTADYTHEFQTRLESGEDVVYLNRETGQAFNKEVAPEDVANQDKYEMFKASEVGNIFPLGTKYSKAFNYEFIDSDGSKKPVIMGSYGIGISRLMGVLVEKFNDDKGIIWPVNVAPFKVHLVDIQKSNEASEVYNTLNQNGIDVLWDDRESTAGEKFAVADLIGCPIRVVISQRSLESGGIEIKKRNENESKVIPISELVNFINNG